MSDLNIEKNLSFEEISSAIQPTLRQEIWHYIRYFFQIFLIVTLVYVGLRSFVFDIGSVDGESMMPNFENLDAFYIDQLTPAFSEYSRGDVVTIFNDTVKGGEFYIKRIVALPGEQIAFENGKVYIKQTQKSRWVEIDESNYIPENRPTKYRNSNNRFEMPILEAKEYYVLGDNREVSKDSRSFGAVERKNIVGRVTTLIVPDLEPVALPKYNIPN